MKNYSFELQVVVQVGFFSRENKREREREREREIERERKSAVEQISHYQRNVLPKKLSKKHIAFSWEREFLKLICFPIGLGHALQVFANLVEILISSMRRI